ncbi:MAG: triose-phosphate isomerase [Microvirga sp.]|jgi:triosephosphate isomerase|nr:triose-phosphate isomerase [Microvirga sp.]
MTRRPLVAGNWKMNGLRASAAELEAMIAAYDASLQASAELVVCPPATLLGAFPALAAGTGLTIGAQDCHPDPAGAHTGDISAEMIADAGGGFVIVGHSERRAEHAETNALVRRKAEAARRAGLVAIVCVGESEAERDAGRALEVVVGQIDGSVPESATGENLVIAYEPIWAIGTGRTPSEVDIEEVHRAMRQALRARFGAEAERIRLLYGGSVKPENARTILKLADVDGALVGGASLKAASFIAIARAYL